MALAADAPSVDGSCLDSVTVFDRDNWANAELASMRAQLFTGDNEVYLSGIKTGDIAFAHTDSNGRIVTFAFVLFRTFYKRLLGLPSRAPLIGNCYTAPAMRGQRLYPAMLRTVCRHLAERGYDRVFISCAPTNHASIRGIERAGFRRTKDIRSTIVLSRVVISRTEVLAH